VGTSYPAFLFGKDLYTTDLRNKGLSNGRFAMICVLGIVVTELVSGNSALEQIGL